MLFYTPAPALLLTTDSWSFLLALAQRNSAAASSRKAGLLLHASGIFSFTLNQTPKVRGVAAAAEGPQRMGPCMQSASPLSTCCVHSVSHIRHVSPRTRHDARVRDCADLPPSQLHLRPLRPPAIQVSRLKRRTGYGFAGLDLTAVSPSLGGPQASSNQVGAGLILMDGQPSRCGLAAAAAATSRAPHVAPRCMDFFPQLLIIKF
jgi:hypothetical protein